MGEVYRARGLQLDRLVAIKILPLHLADNAIALTRFEREARAVAALSHPNILAIFDFGREHDTAFAVMELLEGETLRQKLAGPVPVRKAIDYGVQIARGLAAAHQKGVVHRDLKPENLFVTTDGRVKILDFGLARLEPALTAGASVSPTIARHTEPGTVLGTVGYMSPEQARGEPGDPRSDLFSLGAVLYELVSGRRAFQRSTAPETLTAILREEPVDLATVVAEVPPGLVRVIEHCLEKSPAERFQTASDVAFALENLSGGATSTTRQAESARRGTRTWLPWSVAALFALSSVVLAFMSLTRPETLRPLTRLSVPILKETEDGGNSPYRSLAISPDGRVLVYAGTWAPGRRQLYRRSLDRLQVEPVAGTEGAYQPFFSPDGKWLAFFTVTGDLKKVSLEGGPSVTLTRGLPNAQRGFGVWRSDNTIVLGNFADLLRVSADGGTPTSLTQIDRARNESYHHFPLAVPGTDDILFTVGDVDGQARIELLHLDTRQRSPVLENAFGVALTTSGHLVFVRDRVTMAARFDSKKGVGPAVPLTESVLVEGPSSGPSSQLAVSSSGTATYVPNNRSPSPTLIGWMDSAGMFTELGALPPGRGASAALSPDGEKAATLIDGKVFLFDLVRRVTTPIDLGARQTETVGWHRDGRRLALGGPYLSVYDPDTGKETRLTEPGSPMRFPSWSSDGRTVAFMTFAPNEAIFKLSLDQGALPEPLVATEAIENSPVISPDGRWIAYTSTGQGDQNARVDVYVARFPEGTGRTQITDMGGGAPFWSHDGRELFYPAPPGVLKSVTIAPGDRLQVGPARSLFPLANLRVAGVSPDGKRFLVVRVPPVQPPTEIVVVQDWLRELTRLIPTN